MKILFVAPRFHTNQVGWVQCLIEEGNEVEFHTLLRGGIEDYSDIQPRVYSVCRASSIVHAIIGEGGVNLRRGFPDPFAYFADVRSLRPDVVVVRDIARWFSILGAVASRLIGGQTIIYSQTPLHRCYSRRRRLAIRLILTVFRAKWMTPVMGRAVEGGKVPRGIHYVPFAVEIERRERGARSDEIRLLSVGKFEARKNQVMLIEVIEKLRASGVSVTLTLVGEVSTEEHRTQFERCEDLIEKYGLGEVVRMETNVPHTAIREFYKSHDLFVLPATREPAAISVVESLGFGTPVICSDTNGTRFYVTENDFGATFRDNSPEDLFALIELIVRENRLELFEKNIDERIGEVASKKGFYRAFKAVVDA